MAAAANGPGRLSARAHEPYIHPFVLAVDGPARTRAKMTHSRYFK